MPLFFSTLFRYREKKSPDKLGLYPERFHIEAQPERRYLWTSRILVILCVFSLCVTIMLAMTIFLLLPQKKSTPSLYHMNTSLSELERTQPAETSADPMKLVSEYLISRYITLRHEIPYSQADLMYRWDRDSEFFQLSSIGSYQQFIYKMDYEQVGKLVQQGMARSIDIQWIKQLTPNLWQAQFVTTTTTTAQPQPQIAIWRAYVRVYYIDIKNPQDAEEGIRQYDYDFNPYGFRVKNYALSYLGTPQASEGHLEIAKKISDVRAE